MKPYLLAAALAVASALTVAAALARAPGSQERRTPVGPKDNSACLVCHANFEKEDLAAKHLGHGVTCAHCHGVSREHMDDEESATRPDILFGRAEVEPACHKCHTKHQDPNAVARFLVQWRDRRRPNRRVIRPDSICTDCHGRHRLPPGRVR